MAQALLPNPRGPSPSRNPIPLPCGYPRLPHIRSVEYFRIFGYFHLDMFRLYRSSIHPQHWVVYSPQTGWVAFPRREDGWAQRHPARGLDPLHLREIPLEEAADTGIPGLDRELSTVG